MKNVTLSLPDDLALWARVEAAKADKSVSRYIADMLEEERARAPKATPEETLKKLEEFFAGPGFPSTDGRPLWPGRAAIYGEREDELLRRRERAGLRHRPARSGKT